VKPCIYFFYTWNKRVKTYLVLLKNWFNSSHLLMLRQPLENPNSPPFIFLKGWQGPVKLPTLYNTWSCKEPPTRILMRLKAVESIKNKLFLSKTWNNRLVSCGNKFHQKEIVKPKKNQLLSYETECHITF